MAQPGRALVRPDHQPDHPPGFDSVKRLEQTIIRWLEHWNDNAKPFRWITTVAQIKRSIRNAELTYETRH